MADCILDWEAERWIDGFRESLFSYGLREEKIQDRNWKKYLVEENLDIKEFLKKNKNKLISPQFLLSIQHLERYLATLD